MPVTLTCESCGSEFKRPPSLAHQRFCSVACRVDRLNRKPDDWKHLHLVWRHMIDRCYLPTSSNYARYAGKGITVCDEWRNDFTRFYDWAIANGFAKGLELDREKTRGNYEPDNCRWITHAQNCRNSRKRFAKTSSRFKGVWFETRGSSHWHASITVNAKSTFLGAHKTAVGAAIAYDDAAHRSFGEHACLNFPERKRGAVA